MSSLNTGKRNERKRKNKITINVTLCKYKVITKAAEDRGWELVTDDEDSSITPCNVHWIDVPDFLGTFKIIQPYQKVNHFPGMSNLAQKSKLARNLDRMHKVFPEEFDFYPRTWILPHDYYDFQQQFNLDGINLSKTFIVKPVASCQGRGVFLTQNLNQIPRGENLVAQQYITRPLLLDGKKFDLRIYVLVTSCNPLEVYIFKDGLVRMCTTKYTPPNAENMNIRFMHLTNYAVNKRSNNFEGIRDGKRGNDNENIDGSAGSKRSLKWFFSWLSDSYEQSRVDSLWEKIGDISMKALLTVQPTLDREYKSMFAKYLQPMKHNSGNTMESIQPSDAQERYDNSNSMQNLKDIDEDISLYASSCFAILGLDVLVDDQLRPWLLEVNHLPSFGCDAAIDWNVKERLIAQTFDLLNLSETDKARYQAREAKATKGRLYGNSKLPPNGDTILKCKENAGSSCIIQNQLNNNLIDLLNEKSCLDTEKPENNEDSRSESGDTTVNEMTLECLRHKLVVFYGEISSVRDKKQINIDKIIEKYGHRQNDLDSHLMKKYGRSLSIQSLVSRPQHVPTVTVQLEQPPRPETNISSCSSDSDVTLPSLIDYECLYPLPPKSTKVDLYNRIIKEANRQLVEHQTRFTAPLQHRKPILDEITGLPQLKGAQRKVAIEQLGRDCFGFVGTDKLRLFMHPNQVEKKGVILSEANQSATAHRMMLGHSSQAHSILPPPKETRSNSNERNLNVNYGLQYRERLATIKQKPTLVMSQITFGCFD